MDTTEAPTTGIFKVLDRLIRPLLDKHARSKTIFDGSDLICRLHNSAANGYLRASAHLRTFDDTDLYTMPPHESSLHMLCEFLSHYGSIQMEGIPIDAIRQLAHIALTENAAVYDNKFYKQTLGSAMGSLFTVILPNIFIWK